MWTSNCGDNISSGRGGRKAFLPPFFQSFPSLPLHKCRIFPHWLPCLGRANHATRDTQVQVNPHNRSEIRRQVRIFQTPHSLCHHHLPAFLRDWVGAFFKLETEASWKVTEIIQKNINLLQKPAIKTFNLSAPGTKMQMSQLPVTCLSVQLYPITGWGGPRGHVYSRPECQIGTNE